jgi:long-chain acyl-CoA synthetase
VAKCNLTLPDSTRIRRFLLLTKDFEADDAEMTRTRKLRRRHIVEKYAGLIDALYGGQHDIEVTTAITYEDGRQAEIRSRVVIEDVEAPVGARAVAHA